MKKLFSVVAILTLAVVGLHCNGTAATGSSGGGNSEDVSGDTVVATVAGSSITMDEVKQYAAGALIRVDNQRYEVLRSALEGLGNRALLEKEAEARGVSAEELALTEIEGKVADPTEAEVASAYTANIQRARGRSLEEMRQSIFNTIRNDRLEARTAIFYNELKAKHGFSVTLPVPRVDVAVQDGNPVRGPEDAPVTIIEFGDFECPFCRQAHPTIERVLTTYGDKVRYVFRDFPLSNHPRAVPSAEAAYCAGEQDKYWEYFEHLMMMAGDLNDNDLRQRAEEIGLDIGTFMSCYTSGRYTESIQASFDEGARIGVAYTPTFLINGRMISGAKNFETFKLIIDEELAANSGS